MYIDNISFSNNAYNNLSLNYLPLENFAKVNTLSLDDYKNMPERIELSLSNPITLRYLNYNLKEDCNIRDIDTPLSYDGSLLKRGKVTIASLKNTISFTLHVININNEGFTCEVSIPITLENKETQDSIYNGSYTEEIIRKLYRINYMQLQI